MKRWIAFLLAGFAGVAAVRPGSVTGTVSAQGKESPEKAGGAGKYDSRKYKFAERTDYSTMRDFVVYIEGPVGVKPPASAAPIQVIATRKVSQRGAAFEPHVLPVMVGTTVEWPNNDDIYHNVFSISEAKPFDLGLYKSPEVKRITFDKPGRVDAFCSIHNSMSCIVLVLETPYFALTDDQGRYSITNVPAGAYTLKAWHERLPSQVKEVTVVEDAPARMDFTLGITNLPKY